MRVFPVHIYLTCSSLLASSLDPSNIRLFSTVCFQMSPHICLLWWWWLYQIVAGWHEPVLPGWASSLDPRNKTSTWRRRCHGGNIILKHDFMIISWWTSMRLWSNIYVIRVEASQDIIDDMSSWVLYFNVYLKGNEIWINWETYWRGGEHVSLEI